MTHHERLHQIARAVAEHLPDEWTHEPGSAVPAIAGPDGMRIELSDPAYKRGSVSGKLPDLRGGHRWGDGERERTRIGVTLTRPPAVIAREIARRLLPVYVPIYRELAARDARDREQHRRRSALARRVEALCPPGGRLTVEPYASDRVRLSGVLTEAEAGVVCAALRGIVG